MSDVLYSVVNAVQQVFLSIGSGFAGIVNALSDGADGVIGGLSS